MNNMLRHSAIDVDAKMKKITALIVRKRQPTSQCHKSDQRFTKIPN